MPKSDAPDEGSGPTTFADVPPDFEKQPPAPRLDEKPAAADKPKPERAPRKPPLKKRLEDAFIAIGVAVGTTGDMVCAGVIMAQAEPMAAAWENLAKTSPRVRAAIERLLTGSAWGEVMFATAPVVIAVAVHHDLLPKGFPLPLGFGVPESEEVKQHDPGQPPPSGA